MLTMEMDRINGGNKQDYLDIILIHINFNFTQPTFFSLFVFSFIASSYESANGIKAEEMGDVKNKGSENAIQTVQGSYMFTSPEGQVINVNIIYKFDRFNYILLHYTNLDPIYC
jgi:hypothetical protein